MVNTVLRLNCCCTEKLYSVHSGDLIVPTIAPNAGGLEHNSNRQAGLDLVEAIVDEKA